MRKFLLSAASLALMAGTAYANPHQVSIGGNPTQSQVYGDGSSANSNRNVNTNNNLNFSHSSSRSYSGASATGGNARATGGNSTAYGGQGGRSTAYGGAGGKGGRGGSATVNVYSGGSGDPSGDPSGATNGAANGANDPAGDPSGDPSGGNGGGHGGHGTPTIPVASAVAPSMLSYNPCSGSSTSGAAQFAPFGLSFGTGGGFDNSCRLNQIGLPNVAFAYLCEVNGDIRKAALAANHPCPQDAPKVVQAAAPMPPNERYKFDYCYTASAGELKQHKECEAHRS